MDSVEGPRVYPPQACPETELTPEQLLAISKSRTSASRVSVTDPNEGALLEEAPDQVEKGWLDGPLPFDGNGSLMTGECTQSSRKEVEDGW